MKKTILGSLLVLSALSLFARPSDAAAPVRVVAQFDPNQGQLPESLARDHEGRIVLSFAGAHALATIIPDGHHAAVPLATLPVADGAFSVGVKIGPNRDIFVCTAAFDPTLDASHVWRVTPSGTVSDLVHLSANGFPNDIAFDDDGALFVTDSQLGVVYKVEQNGRSRVWLRDPRLLGNPAHPLVGSPLGANGIVFDRRERHLYVGNTDFGTVFRVRVKEDGEPGPLELFVADSRLNGADGLAFDDHGHLYLAANIQNQIVRIDRDGAITIVAQGAPLDAPSAFAFSDTDDDGYGRDRDGTTLFITSFAIARAQGLQPGTPTPSLDSIQVPFPGLPLP